jgi:hypothetical protein
MISAGGDLNVVGSLRDIVGWTLTDAESLMRPLDLVEEVRPPQFTHAIAQQRGATYLLQSGGWIDRPRTLNAKWCRLQSPKVDVAMLMIYPTGSPDLLPVFGAEWVVVGERVMVAVMDVHPIGNQPTLESDLETAFHLIGQRHHRLLPPADDPPDWFRAIAKPWAVFTHGPMDILGPLADAFREYLTAAIEGWYLPRQWESSGTDSAAVSDYKRMQYDHSPGREMLRATFGGDYTEAFLGWHCGPPNQTLQQTGA